MKILHIVPWYKPAYMYGGPIESVAKLCESTITLGHTVNVYTTTAFGDEELNVNVGDVNLVNGVNVTYFKRNTKDPTNISLSLWKTLRKTAKDYDLVHIHSWWNPLAIMSSYICHLKKVKVIISPRGMLSPYIFESSHKLIKSIIHNTIAKRLLAKSYFHATSTAEYDECLRLIPTWKGFILPNILSLPDNVGTKTENQIFTMLFMSRLHPKKGLEHLFEALSKLDIKYMLKIAGTGEEKYVESLHMLAQGLGITNNLIWLGWKDRTEKFEELRKADLFVLTSANENFANVVVESLHVGTAVLISKGVALSDFVEDRNLGWVTTLEVADIQDNLEKAYCDKAKRKDIVNSGKLIINEIFNERKVTQKYVDAYEIMINQKSLENG